MTGLENRQPSLFDERPDQDPMPEVEGPVVHHVYQDGRVGHYMRMIGGVWQCACGATK